NVSRTWPWLSSTSRHPAFDVAAVPFFDGRLPTITQLCTVTSAVVSPMPPGQAPGRPRAEIFANTVRCPGGLTWTMVVPVPCRFFLSLKLLTSTLPLCSLAWLCLTTATPYGLTSALRGTVDPTSLVWWRLPIKV